MKNYLTLFFSFVTLLSIASCSKNSEVPLSFKEEIKFFDVNEELTELYYQKYLETNNLILAVNMIDHPLFLTPNSYKQEAIDLGMKTLINTNYYITTTPNNLVPLKDIPGIDYIDRDNVEELMNEEALKHYQAFSEEAIQNGYTFTIFSAYRTPSYQEKLYNEAGDKSLVAKPNHSEHHTGLAVDIGLRNTGIGKYFEATIAYSYLINNITRYGFILRYPKGKEKITGYPYESWHFRYVGEAVAKEITSKKITLEEYIYQNIIL